MDSRDETKSPISHEVGKNSSETPQPQLVLSSEAEDNDSHYLWGKPFVDIVLPRSSVFPHYQQHMPASMSKQLPHKTVPVVLTHGGKSWNMSYMGGDSRPRLDPKWKTFAKDNNLKMGDACVFELMENTETNVRFKVHILRRDLPPELLEMLNSRGVSSEMIDPPGETPETPICLD